MSMASDDQALHPKARAFFNQPRSNRNFLQQRFGYSYDEWTDEYEYFYIILAILAICYDSN